MRILVGLSGGFDSAYTAMLLANEGHTVEGAVLDMHCYTEITEAKETADSLGIPFHVIPCRELFDREVVENFCDAYAMACTPNPCIVCNERVKFRALYDYAMAQGFDRVATGHYANVVRKNGRLTVAVAKDHAKDQSYMLYRLPEEILENLLLPMGAIIKKEAKKDETCLSIGAVEREESQDICFIKGEGHAEYIERRRGALVHGDFVSESGEVLGHHRGIVRYTVGQRKGLGVSAASRLFVKEIDPASNRIILSDRAPDHRAFCIKDVVFSGMTKEEALMSTDLRVRVRYSTPAVGASLYLENDRLWVRLAESSRCAVTPGQSAVFYVDDCVVFGGIIDYTPINGNNNQKM